MASMCRMFFPTPEARKPYFSFDALWRPRGAYLFLPLQGLEVNILKSSSLVTFDALWHPFVTYPGLEFMFSFEALRRPCVTAKVASPLPKHLHFFFEVYGVHVSPKKLLVHRLKICVCVRDSMAV